MKLLSMYLKLQDEPAFIQARENNSVLQMRLILRSTGYSHTEKHCQQMLSFKTPTNMEVLAHQMEKAKELLTYTTDGPVDTTVILFRAFKLARLNEFPVVGIYDPLAEAVADLLENNTE